MDYKLVVPATIDTRGSISDIFTKWNFEHSAIINTPYANENWPAIRGNHYHKESTQAIFILSGGLTYWWKSLDEDTVHNKYIPEYGIVFTPANEIHALEIRTPTKFIAFSHGLRGGNDYESDTFRVDSIIPANRMV